LSNRTYRKDGSWEVKRLGSWEKRENRCQAIVSIRWIVIGNQFFLASKDKLVSSIYWRLPAELFFLNFLTSQLPNFSLFPATAFLWKKKVQEFSPQCGENGPVHIIKPYCLKKQPKQDVADLSLDLWKN